LHFSYLRNCFSLLMGLALPLSSSSSPLRYRLPSLLVLPGSAQMLSSLWKLPVSGSFLESLLYSGSTFISIYLYSVFLLLLLHALFLGACPSRAEAPTINKWWLLIS
jgi:hypothetical protein